MVLLRLVERIGVAILIGCGVSLFAGSILLWHGRAALPLTEILLGIVVLTGAVWGIVGRPTVFQAALEVDRQTNSAELFSSSLLVDSGWLMVVGNSSPSTIHHSPSTIPGNSFTVALVAAAEERCRDKAMADVTFRRFGGRAWGGILLAVALVITMVMLGPAPAKYGESASNNAAGDGSKSSKEDPADSRRLNFIGSADNRPIMLADPDDLNSNTFGQEQKTAADQSQEKAGNLEPSDARAAASSNDGVGGGTGRTERASNSNTPLTEHARDSGKPASDKTGTPASGSGSASALTAGGTSKGVAGTVAAGDADHSTRPPPWGTSTWPAQVEVAHKAIDGGHVPAVYRDLIRDYFSPEAISTALHD